MLSYRHSFHAGNYADIIKHVVAVEIFEHFIKKEKPFEYIDTHSGAGLFDLRSSHAQKLEEHVDGIGKLKAKEFPELSRYFKVIDAFNRPGFLTHYPGSPSVAKHFLRPQDRAWLYELHPQDFKKLCKNTDDKKKMKVFFEDGLKGLKSVMPPASRRGFVLIDPSYEVKSEYDQVFHAVEDAYKKFTTGTYAVWYPVVDRRKIDRLEHQFVRSGIKNIQRFELGVSADSEERGMTSAGMIVVNPPWTLFKKMSAVLPKLARVLGDDGVELYKCDILSGE